MAPTLNVTHIGTATAILEINGARVVLEVTADPALRLDQLPVIDAVLLSHEDHPDNLDDLGRQLLDGRRVFTTIDGGRKLAPRPAVHGMDPREEINIIHVPGNERNAQVPSTDDRNSPPMQITMGGKDGARLFRGLQADVLVLMHYEPWKYFTRFETELRQAFEAEDISDKICWLKGARR
ncbi:hypothetical protein BDW68DRAFT_191081 [Aspergillus falconensis]